MAPNSKKRRLSPSASSRASSATPAPAHPFSQAALDGQSPSALPADFDPDQTGVAGVGLAGPGPSTLGHARQYHGSSKLLLERRTYARTGTLVYASGDGQDAGEECFILENLPFSKNFRYAPCTLSPNASPHPAVPFYRTIPYPPPVPPVHISWLDRSAFLRISPTALTITNDRGFRSGRANVSVRQGSWYYEVYIERGNGAAGGGGGTGGEAGNAHVRIGWGRREANLEAPVGADGYSYALRDVGGEKIHLARALPYSRSFKTGDVVGCLITLPPREAIKTDESSPDNSAVIKRHRRHFNYKNQMYFEMPEYPTSKEMDALVDRAGTIAAAKAKEEELRQQNGNATHGSDGALVNGNGNGPAVVLGKGKKGATTKNAKKGKKTVQVEEAVEQELRELVTLKGSSISFYLNGEPLGEAFKDIYDFTPLPPLHVLAAHGSEILRDDGTMGYYPMISCFGKGKARCNFGPEFTFPPAIVGSEVKAMSERWTEFREEEEKLDEIDEREDTKRLLATMEDEKRLLMANGAKGDGTGKKKRTTMAKRKKGMMDSQTPAPDSTSARATPAPSEADIKTETPDLNGEDMAGDGGQDETKTDVIDTSVHAGVMEGKGDGGAMYLNNGGEAEEEFAEKQGAEESEDGEEGVQW